MEYTILQLATLAGVSTRTLRYYDQTGLLTPLRNPDSQYRIYGDHEVDVLQQILFYKEMGFELSAIKDIIHNPGFNSSAALKSHLQSLEEKEKKVRLLIQTVKKSIEKEEGKIKMTNEEKFAGLKESLIEQNELQYGTEIRQAYGEETVDKSNQKFSNLSKKEYDAMQALTEKINIELEAAVTAGISYQDEKGKEIALMHKEWLSYTWSSYSVQAHHGLTDMYIADERFQKYYDKKISGCAQFLNDAVHYHLQ